MAPVKPAKRMARKSATSGPSKTKKPTGKLPQSMTKQIKTKPGAQALKPKKKPKIYSEKQLNLPVLNSIIPANAKTVQRAGGTGKKKKIFVDDVESMSTILAIVTAEKEGEVESKVANERKKEEVRQARLKEAESKEKKRADRVEEKKGELKRKKKDDSKERKSGKRSDGLKEKVNEEARQEGGKRKRKSVSFAD